MFFYNIHVIGNVCFLMIRTVPVYSSRGHVVPRPMTALAGAALHVDVLWLSASLRGLGEAGRPSPGLDGLGLDPVKERAGRVEADDLEAALLEQRAPLGGRALLRLAEGGHHLDVDLVHGRRHAHRVVVGQRALAEQQRGVGGADGGAHVAQDVERLLGGPVVQNVPHVVAVAVLALGDGRGIEEVAHLQLHAAARRGELGGPRLFGLGLESGLGLGLSQGWG